MRRRLMRALCIGGLATFPAAVVAQMNSVPREPYHAGSSVYIDQDTFLKQTTDKDYTMGVLLSRSGAWVQRWWLDRPLTWLDERLGSSALHHVVLAPGGAQAFDTHTFQLGVSAFTPLKGERGRILEQREPIPNDRPYACLGYVSARRTTAYRTVALSTSLDVGVLGLPICKAVQTDIHEAIGDVRPGGWHNQISHGGEPTARYRIAPAWLLLAGELGSLVPTSDYDVFESHWLDLTVDTEASVGYYTNVAGGARLRFGLINSPFWQAARRPVGPVTVTSAGLVEKRQPQAAASDEARRSFRVDELFVWVSGGATAWGYNALLQGQLRHSEVELDFGKDDDPLVASLNRFTSDVQVGGTIGFPRFSVSYQYNWQSAAFGGRFSRRHAWGGVYVSVW